MSVDLDGLLDEAPEADLAAAPGDLQAVLTRLASLREEASRLDDASKKLSREIKDLEKMAIDQLQVLGLKGVKTDNRTWYVQEVIGINVPKENRDRVLAAAANIVDADGNSMADEIRTVLTGTLKSWLVERWKALENKKPDQPIAAGTEFEGLVSEYRSFRLGSAKRR